MEIILIIAVYILGCVLAYGRVRASFYNSGLYSYYKRDYVIVIVVTLLSWAGFVTGCLVYSFEDEQKFFKFK